MVKDWASVDVRWCLCYPDAYEVGQPNQGVAILYEILNERDWILAERTYAVWPDLEALMREHGVPQFTLDCPPPGRRLRRARVQLRHRARLHQHAERAGPGRHPDPCRGPAGAGPDRAGRRARSLQPRAGRRLPRRRGAGRRRGGRADDLRDGPGVEGRGPTRRPGRAAAPAGRRWRGLRAQVLRRGLPAGRADPPGGPQPARGAVPGGQAHPDGPGRLALPEASRWCRWPRRCTSATRWRSSAAAPGAAGSARPA